MLQLLFCLSALQTDTTVIHLTEEVLYEVEGLPAQKSVRQVYIGPNQVRTDFGEENISLIYDLNLGTLIVVDNSARTYYLSRPGREKELSRSPLTRFVTQTDGMLTLSGPIVTATGRDAIIGGSECREFLMNPRSLSGTTVTIWATVRQIRDRNEFKKIWFAASGTKPPQDVKDVVHRIFRDLKGAPVKIVAEYELEGFKVTTSGTYVAINRNFEPTPRFFDIPENYDIVQGQSESKTKPWQN